jgi:hypothetical protein
MISLKSDNITAIEPGGIWDDVLLEYCKGKRTRPVWGISTADFHKDGGAGVKLGDFSTIFLVPQKKRFSLP